MVYRSSGQRMTSLSIDAIGPQSQMGGDLVVEGVLERFGERNPLRRLVLEHALNEIEEQDVVLFVRHLVAFQRLAVLAHVTPGRAFLVPVEPAVVEVFRLRFAAHSKSNGLITFFF